jgi:hypothetical protein
MVRQPSPRTAAFLFVAALALIGLMTLTPSSAYVATPTFCVFCGTLGGVDFTLNVLLFVPLGLALRWLTGRWIAIVGIAGLTTLAIETLQWRLIPGRDASLGDLIANTLGAMIGAWLVGVSAKALHATPAGARVLSAVSGIVTSILIVVSAWLLRPIDPIGAQYVQWAPDREDMDVFRGRLVAVQLNGRLLRPFEAFPSQWTYDSVTQAMAVRAVIGTPIPPSERQAIIIRIVNEEYEGFMLAQRGDAVVFRSTMGAARLKLRSILIGLDHALTTPTPTDPVLLIHAISNPRVMGLVRELKSGETEATLRRTVGLAWAMLLPWDRALDSRWWPVNALWLAALVFPVTFLTMRSVHKRTVNRNPGFDYWPLGLALIALLVAPASLGLSALGPGEWLGVGIGVAAGVLVERAATVSLSKATSSEVAPTMQS